MRAKKRWKFGLLVLLADCSGEPDPSAAQAPSRDDDSKRSDDESVDAPVDRRTEDAEDSASDESPGDADLSPGDAARDDPTESEDADSLEANPEDARSEAASVVTAVPPAVDPPEACEVGAGRVGLQRLTRSEYNRTVRDLFGVTSNPAAALPSDSTTGGFDNNASSLSVSPQSLELWLDLAESVAAEAMQNGAGRISGCDAEVDGALLCGQEVIAALGRRVVRRPLMDEELTSLMRLVDFALAGGESFERGIEYALAAMLSSPQFLYRNVPPSVAPAGVSALDDYALATRLSYFVWGSTPDDALLDSAGQGALRDPIRLRAEFDRMLGDDKASALFDGFFSQWLALGKLSNAWPDDSILPGFSDEVREQMLQEARLFFSDVVARDGSALEFINGRSTFVNETLAGIYGVSGVTGSELVRVDTDPSQRAGVLTMPVILTMTSDPDRTNIVRRGSWLAESILCAAPPPPPENVSPLPDPLDGETEREQLLRHRADPACAPCHNLIDPLGFPFDNYDAAGHWREDLDGQPVDVAGQMPDGRAFDGVQGLVQLLEEGPDYKTCVSQKLMSYALGRVASSRERCVLSAIGEQTVAPDSSFSDLLWAIVTSDAFQRQEAEMP